MGPTLPSGLNRIIILSATAHVALIVGVVMAGSLRLKHRGPAQTVLVTKLVRLGKERPENWLPRKSEPPPPPAREPVAVAARPAAATSEPALPSARDRLRELTKVSSALDRLKKNAAPEEVEGRPDGAINGEVSDLAHAVAGNRYASEIFACIKSNYVIEGVDPERVRNHSAVVFLRIDAEGRFIDHRIERGSGLAVFDAAVDRAVLRCNHVSPPPPELRAQVRGDGIEVEFQL